jgi:hypothetical protein
MYKTPTFAEPQQYNIPFSTGQLLHAGVHRVEKTRKSRWLIDFLQMNGYVPCGIISIYVFFFTRNIQCLWPRDEKSSGILIYPCPPVRPSG